MPRARGERIMGVETEFGTLVQPEFGRPEDAVAVIKDCAFYELKLGAIDLHSRDEVFEPAMSGGFLLNGGRLYIDAVGSHLEYATAECRSVKDLVAQIRAGRRLIVRAMKEAGIENDVDVYCNSIDHFGGHTFGCHENYLVQMDEDFFSDKAPLMVAFLVTRQVFAGVGRVGGHILATGGPGSRQRHSDPVDTIWVSHVYDALPDPSVEYQLSQRADHIIRVIASRVRFNRAIINPKWEHFYSHDGMHRLHLLFGESNQSEYAEALKLGTTSLVLRAIEDGHVPYDLQLADPLGALRSVSRDPTYGWEVVMADGEPSDALAVQCKYLELCKRYRKSGGETAWILAEWERTLNDLASDPLSMTDRLDWVAKRQVLQAYMDDAGCGWSDDSLHSVDLEYHNIDPERSLFDALPVCHVVEPLDIVEATVSPPKDTRALGRSKLVAKALAQSGPKAYIFDWSGVLLGRSEYFDMPDPFETYT